MKFQVYLTYAEAETAALAANLRENDIEWFVVSCAGGFILNWRMK